MIQLAGSHLADEGHQVVGNTGGVFADASAFWASVAPVFRELVDACDANRDRVVAKYTEQQRREAFNDAGSAVQFVRNAFDKGNVSELPGTVGRTGVRDALMALMLEVTTR